MNQIADQIAGNLENMIASPRVIESMGLLSFLRRTGTDDPEACCAFLMERWSEEQSIFVHDTIWMDDYEIIFIDGGGWRFENMERNIPMVVYPGKELLNALKTTNRLVSQGLA